jgi:hypothetical protein
VALDLERRARVGLCATCAHARSIQSAKGSEFWLCEKSKTDPRFKKYPPLPVRACLGFVRSEPAPR